MITLNTRSKMPTTTLIGRHDSAPTTLGAMNPRSQKSPGKITKNPGILTAGTQEWRFGSDDFPLANGWIFRWFQAVRVQGWSVILPCSQRGQRRSHHLNGGFGIFGTGFFRGGFGYRKNIQTYKNIQTCFLPTWEGTHIFDSKTTKLLAP